ncbi:MAG TPA: hypothetical protein VGC53_00690 [Vicinamibacteria bacterium]|jgi:hypothetical protein
MNQVSLEENPLDKTAGLSPSRERRWGMIGGTVGSLVGIGAGLIGFAIDGVPWYSSGPYPDVFTEHRLLALDVYLLVVFFAGLGFSTAAAIYSRRSAHPRSDAFAAGLLGTILMGISGLIFFTRVVALIAV